MKTIVFFSRLKLTYLYGALHKSLSDNFNIIHLAYSRTEYDILKNDFGISDVLIFQDQVNQLYASHEYSEELSKLMDKDFLEYSKNQFTLNGALQADRTYSDYPLEDVMKISQVYYLFWDSLFSKTKVDYLIHEPVALFMTHSAAIISRKYNSNYLSMVNIIGLKNFNWVFLYADSGEMYKANTTNSISYSRIEITKFLDEFEKSHNLHLGNLSSKRKGNSIVSFTKLVVKHLFKARIKNRGILHHIDDYLHLSQQDLLPKLYERNRFSKIEYYIPKQSEQYFYYPLHAEPEAVVLYWAVSKYKYQVKLIENLAASLPSGKLLYVKDHPARPAFQQSEYYNRILRIPNVRLIHSEYSGMHLIKGSLGVFTINGTAGFEGALLGKPVLVLSDIYYDCMHNVHKCYDINQVTEYTYEILEKLDQGVQNNNFLIDDVMKIVEYSHSGFVAYFSNYPEKNNINLQDNADEVALGFNNLIN